MPAQQPSPSPMALVAIITGGVGLLMTFVGCVFGPFMCMGTTLCLVGLIAGVIEINNVNAGNSAEANKSMAMAGAGLGGGGCAIQALFAICFGVFFALYFVLIVLMAAAGA